MYVDGNDLQCEGLIELVKLCADHAEEESYQREQERARKEQEEAEAERRGESTLFLNLKEIHLLILPPSVNKVTVMTLYTKVHIHNNAKLIFLKSRH